MIRYLIPILLVISLCLSSCNSAPIVQKTPQVEYPLDLVFRTPPEIAVWYKINFPEYYQDNQAKFEAYIDMYRVLTIHRMIKEGAHPDYIMNWIRRHAADTYMRNKDSIDDIIDTYRRILEELERPSPHNSV